MHETSLRSLLWRVTAAHMITYFIVGLVASTVFDYGSLYATTELRHLMRPTTTAWVAAGPALQVVRGVLFALVLWPLSDRLLDGKRGALLLSSLSPGSLEGVVFTTLPLRIHALGLPEVIVQTGAFSFLLVAWCRRPARWMNVVAAVAVTLLVLMSVLGVLAAQGIITPPSG